MLVAPANVSRGELLRRADVQDDDGLVADQFAGRFCFHMDCLILGRHVTGDATGQQHGCAQVGDEFGACDHFAPHELRQE